MTYGNSGTSWQHMEIKKGTLWWMRKQITITHFEGPDLSMVRCHFQAGGVNRTFMESKVVIFWKMENRSSEHSGIPFWKKIFYSWFWQVKRAGCSVYVDREWGRVQGKEGDAAAWLRGKKNDFRHVEEKNNRLVEELIWLLGKIQRTFWNALHWFWVRDSSLYSKRKRGRCSRRIKEKKKISRAPFWRVKKVQPHHWKGERNNCTK